MQEKRIQKIIAECGITSRRKAEELIERGRVRVNGHVAVLGQKADLDRDVIIVNGVKLESVSKVYIALNKPRGYVTTMNDDKGRKCVADLLGDVPEHVVPIGRLDKDSEGLLLLTNDGDFANMLAHPVTHVPKMYRVVLDKLPTEEQLYQFERGMLLDGETRKTAPARIELVSHEVRDGKNRIVSKVTLYEGRNRQIRRMFEHFGINVTRLKRLSVGVVKLGQLSHSKWRYLEKEEVQSLKRMAGPREKAALERGKRR